jgi:hypothetical protein
MAPLFYCGIPFSHVNLPTGRGTLPLPYPLQDMPLLIIGARLVGAFSLRTRPSHSNLRTV